MGHDECTLCFRSFESPFPEASPSTLLTQGLNIWIKAFCKSDYLWEIFKIHNVLLALWVSWLQKKKKIHLLDMLKYQPSFWYIVLNERKCPSSSLQWESSRNDWSHKPRKHPGGMEHSLRHKSCHMSTCRARKEAIWASNFTWCSAIHSLE